MRNLLLTVIFFFGNGLMLYAQNCSINAGVGAVICQKDTILLNGTRSGALGSNSVSFWTQISGPSVIINSPNSLITKVYVYEAGIYKFRLSIKCRDGLIAADSVIMNVLPLTVSDAGRDTLLCPVSGLFLNGNTPSNNETGKWTIVSNNNAGITISSPSNPRSAITLNPNISGLSTLRWTITNSNGCISYDDVVITNCGGVVIVNAGEDQVLSNCFSSSTCTNLSASNGGNGLGGQKGVWTFVSGPTIPVINNPLSATTKVCNLTEGTYVFRYTVSGPCANGFDEVSIFVPKATQDITPANANPFAASINFCGIVNTLPLNGNNPLYTGETVLWSQISGPPVIINNANSPSATATGFSSLGAYCFSYSISNSASNCTSNSIVCYTFYNGGTVDAGADQILPCNVTTATINTVTSGSGTLNFKIISGPSGVFPSYPVNYRTSNVINGMTLPGTYRVEVNYSFGTGCSPINDFVDITVSRIPAGSNAGTDQYFACSSTTTQLAGNNPALTGFGSGRWSQISGPNSSTLVTPTNYVCNIRGTVPGAYTYRWTITGGSKCSDNFDDINVVIPDTSVTKANAGVDKIICPYSAFSLSGNTIRADETVQWTSIPGGVTFLPNSTSIAPSVNGLAINTAYQFIYTITNSCGSISRDTVLVTTSSAAGPSFADAGPNQCLPSGTSVIQLNAENPSSGAGTWTKISGPAATITNAGLNNTTVTGISNATYQFVWTISAPGCLNVTSDTVMITVSPNTTISNAGTDISTCSDNVVLNANIPVNGTGSWSQISGDGSAIISSVSNPKAAVSNLTTGVYIFRWTINNFACASSSDEVKITISSAPSQASAGTDQVLCGINANQTILNAVVPVNGNGQWVQVSGPASANIVNNTSATTNVTNLINGIYTFRWIVTGGPGCPQSTDEVQVSVSQPAHAGPDQRLCNLNSTTLSGNTGSNGVWTQISGPATTIIQSPQGNPQATVTGLSSGNTYVFRYTIPAIFGCPPTYDEVLINNGSFAQVPDAGADASYCNSTIFPLSGSQPGQGETGVWSVLSGPGGAVFSPSANAPNATLTGAVPGTYVLKWTISNFTCSSSDQKRIENYATPSVANAGADQTVCFGRAILRGNNPSKGIGTWTQINGPLTVTIASVNNAISDVTGFTTVGTYGFVWTITNGPVCTPSRDTVRLVVSDLSPSIANAGADTTYCNLSEIYLKGNIPASGIGTWSELNTSSAQIVSPNSGITAVNTLNTGIHNFIWSIANGNNSCISRDTIRITNNVSPNTARAGLDDTFCVFSTILLNANAAITATSGNWSFVSGPNTPRLLSPNLPQCQVVGVVQGTYKFLWTISSPSCTSSADEVNITVIPDANLAIAGANQSLCAESINLYANAPTGNNKGIWSQAEGPNNVIFVTESHPNSIVTGLITGTYRFVWKIYNQGCFTTDTVTYNISEPAIVNAGNDTAVCNTVSEILLTSAVFQSPDDRASWSVISGGGSLSVTGPTTTPNTVTYIPEQDYQGTVLLRLTAQDACHLVSDDIEILINNAIVPVNAKDDSVAINLNSPVIINVLANDVLFYVDTLNLCRQQAIAINPVHGTASANYDGTISYTPDVYFTGIDSFQYQICTEYTADSNWYNLCFREGSDSAWVFISVSNEDCKIPNAFSPNGDGINDVFIIECGTNKQFYLFNNWGIELYRNEDYQNNWGGTYNGSPLPDGTYFYSLKYLNDTNEVVSKAGFICLHR